MASDPHQVENALGSERVAGRCWNQSPIDQGAADSEVRGTLGQ
jgi:hypothetical protein